jgi:hypothetical protein
VFRGEGFLSEGAGFPDGDFRTVQSPNGLRGCEITRRKNRNKREMGLHAD